MVLDNHTRNEICQKLARWLPVEDPEPILLDSRGLKDIARCKHTIIPGQRATPALVLVIKIGEEHWTAAMPMHHPGSRATVPICRLDVLWRPSVYQGTLFRTVQYQEDGIRHYIIQDVLAIRGDNVLCHTYQHRLELATSLINTDLRTRGQTRLHMTLTYDSSLVEMKNLCTLIRQDGLRRLKSLIFYPNSWGGRSYIYHIQDGELTGDKTSYTTCYLYRTGQPDVYLLTNLDDVDMGTALIPNIETSKLCRQLVSRHDKVKVRCRNDPRTGKWVPVVQDD